MLCRLKVDPEKDIMNISVDSFSSQTWIGGNSGFFIPECFLNVTFFLLSVFKLGLSVRLGMKEVCNSQMA